MTPSGLSAAILAIDSPIAAEQGVKTLVVGYQQQSHVFQDIAAVQATYRICRAYLNSFGYGDVSLFRDFHSWVGRFPEDTPSAYGVICQAAVTAALANVQMIMSKSIDQGCHLPAKDANAAGVKATKQIISAVTTS